MKEFLKNFIKINFNLNFTSSKLLAYIIVILGTYVSIKLQNDNAFTMGVIAASALFGTKVLSNKINQNKE